MLPRVLCLLFIICEASRAIADIEKLGTNDHVIDETRESPGKGLEKVSDIRLISLDIRNNLLQVERRSLVIAAILVAVTIVVLVSGTIVVRWKHGGNYEYEVLSHEDDKSKLLKPDTDEEEENEETEEATEEETEKREEKKHVPIDNENECL
ncbi:hypothetical protein ScPMuIL_007794 [Solemya velum]